MLSLQVEIVCGATLPSCTTALIVVVHNKRDQSYQNLPLYFYMLHLFFHVFWTLGPAFVKWTKESYRIEEHFNPTIAFRRIHRQIRSPRMESLEIRTERTLVNTKHKVTLPSHDHLQFFSLFCITVLNTS